MIYIVVLNWKNAPDTIACLDSLFKLRQVDYRIVVCDNQSPDDSYQQIRDWLQQQSCGYMADRRLIELNKQDAESYRIPDSESGIYLVQTGSNLGFAGGNNVGIRFAMNQADMQYIWLLNNDTEVAPDALWHLVQRCQSDSQIGICGSRLVYFHDRAHLQGLGGVYNRWLGTTRHYAAYAPSDAVFDDEKVSAEIDYVIGASMLLTRPLLEQVGLLCEDYFLYFEELDICTRAKNLGKKISVCTSSIVYHKEGASTAGGKSDVSDFFSVRNRLIITKKFNKCYFPVVYFSLLLCIANRIRRNEFRKAFNIFKYLVGLDVDF